ncbi:glycoside hydrolase/phage tail family protein [Parvibaculum sp.]|uniref:baseplate multidomain protein megatron n=1 Tax=Parvibaculum sp. TaxID=2024848 RepID=UPI0032108CD0
MATLLLSTAGSALGSAFLPGGLSFLGATVSGAALGGAIGAGLGSYVDQQLFGSTVANSEGPRLSDLQVLSSTEGAPVPRLYGRARLGGQLIWATNYKEHKSTESTGGKGGGGASVTSYSYTVSFAVALCEGPITRIGRVWADGNAMTLEDVTWRLHKGDGAQMPDPTIEAVEGTGNAPAYRGVAYIVFEDLPLADYGNRIPQLSFEVFRSLSDVEEAVRAVTIIPGAGEFVYDTNAVREILSESSSRAVNTHSSESGSDWAAALDQLQDLCPNVASASLVVSWFGDDLRCGQCTVRPKVETGWKITTPQPWSAGGISRGAAQAVSQVDGMPAFGGTPSDASVVRAIGDMKSRGLRTVFYPFVMMDIPGSNTLADPWSGAASQPAYPWRGRITCSPAAGQAGSVDKTAAAAAQVADFFGDAGPGDFHVVGNAVTYSGPEEWSYRRMILHYAHLCAAAGGVDAFLIGSELKGLTQIRSDASTYPAVAALKTLAADVAGILGGATKISYAADWTEYAGHDPADGTGDRFFHLDPLWADSNIHFVGIDAYAPLTDWRKTNDHLDRDLADTIYDIDYLKSRIAGGEDFDWYYASDADRAAQIRSPITDGAYGKPWVFRAKDIRSWWANEHRDRPGGVESPVTTAWVVQGKPVWFTEIGCPAIDKGTNEPNLFVDAKSSESAMPHFSTGTRDDYIQRCFIEAQTGYWSEEGAHNPVSSVYGGRMLDPGDMFFWTWDARPFPAFPDRTDLWADGENWQRGHWLNGRLGAVPLGALVSAILGDVGFSAFDVGELAGVVEGFVIDRIMSPRQAIEPLMLARFFDAAESEGVIRFRHYGAQPVAVLTPDRLAVEEDSAEAGYRLTRGQETELPLSAKLSFIDGGTEYRQATVEARRLGVSTQRVSSATMPMVMTAEDAQGVADIWLQKSWSERETATLKLPPSLVALDPGDVVELALPARTARYRLMALTDGEHREARAVASEASLYGRFSAPRRTGSAATVASYGVPLAVFLDLPMLTGEETPYAPRVAVAADPWPGGVALWKNAGNGFALDRVISREATLGRTTSALAPGVTSRWDYSQVLTVSLVSGALSSATESAVLGGANVAAVQTPDGDWEVIQFRGAALISAGTYELSGLLRGQAGTEAAMRSSLAAGARFMLIDGAVNEIGLGDNERGLERIWAWGPASKPIDDASYASAAQVFQGVGLRPLSPVHLRARREASGDIAIGWTRRTRVNGDGWLGVDVPLGEEEERYALDILSGGSVVRSFDVTSAALSYSSAMQIEDFGSATFATLNFRVAQISRAFGRGTAREATLHV